MTPAASSLIDFDRCYRAVEARDRRFDGWFITGVTSTGIYCRPSCPTPIQPKRENVSFYPNAAAAQLAGFRACKRCRPDASPGSPEWDLRADLAGRAVRLIADGVVDRVGVRGLAEQLAVSERNLSRILRRELGASPVALARAQRAQTARVLVETTDMTFTQIAFAAGFGSVRQFNDTVRTVYALSPSELRRRAGASKPSAPAAGSVTVRLQLRNPFDWDGMVSWVSGHSPEAILRRLDTGSTGSTNDTDSTDDTGGTGGTGGTSEVVRTLRLPQAHGTARCWLGDSAVHAELNLADFADLTAAVARLRRLFDLDADPDLLDEHFADTPLARLAAENRGQRVPGAVDGFEQAVMTVLGQQVSVKAGQRFGSRLVEQCGTEVITAYTGVNRVFPSPETLAEADLDSVGLTGQRRSTVTALATAVAEGAVDLSPGADRERARQNLLAVRGIGPWTADIIAMRALGDPDVLPTGDLVLRKAAGALGLPETETDLAAVGTQWAPWRSYAAHHLWASAVRPKPRTVNFPEPSTSRSNDVPHRL